GTHRRKFFETRTKYGRLALGVRMTNLHLASGSVLKSPRTGGTEEEKAQLEVVRSLARPRRGPFPPLPSIPLKKEQPEPSSGAVGAAAPGTSPAATQSPTPPVPVPVPLAKLGEQHSKSL